MVRLKKINFIFFITLLFFLFAFQKVYLLKNQTKHFDDFYNKLSIQEKKNLTLFFNYLFYENFGYVLFGDKPMGMYSIYNFKLLNKNKIKPLYKIANSYYQTFNPQNKFIKDGFNSIKKYSKFFNNNYCFLKEKNPFNEETELIIFINKKNFIDIINLNIIDFERVLNKPIIAEDLLNECIKGKNLLTDTLKKHQGLIGMLLGYGRNNAWSYYIKDSLNQKNDSLIDHQNIEVSEFFLPFCLEDCDEVHSNITKILEFKNKDFIDYSFCIEHMTLPIFFADPNSVETKKLEEIYKNNREDIKKKFHQNDFLYLVLENLISFKD
ncbi:MAG: hypothetical protein A3F40_04040 [Chlamydiae bacterium RIFCSPHIGHO2_12_FULL_27_8]|nr:MAG: hypothetical protein A3F40_04040 [Chlamydiae bacterium RIFCSPHIGHO2_12_FULL_27_8]